MLRLRTQVVTNQDGSFIVLENDGIGGTLLAGKRWEPHFASIVQSLSIRGTTALDVGANIGCNAVHLARAVGDKGLVLAFEPQRIPFQQLCGTVVLSGFHNVVALQQAVGDRQGSVELQPVNYFQDQVNIGNTGLGSGGERVGMTTLDSLNLQNVSFIKLDVQGAETMVLRGAEALIKRERPLLFIEIEEQQLGDRGTSAAELIGTLFSLGYVLLHIRNDYPVDFVAIPEERREEAASIAAACGHPTALCVAE